MGPKNAGVPISLDVANEAPGIRKSENPGYRPRFSAAGLKVLIRRQTHALAFEAYGKHRPALIFKPESLPCPPFCTPQ
jgi:hypothetical protein